MPHKQKTPLSLGFFNENEPETLLKLVGGEGLEPPTFWV